MVAPCPSERRWLQVCLPVGSRGMGWSTGRFTRGEEMKRSTDRILTTHAGSLPRPDDLRELLNAKQNGQLPDEGTFTNRVRSAVDEVVQLQLGSGVDCVNDGELGKSNFNNYAQLRLSGFEEREV